MSGYLFKLIPQFCLFSKKLAVLSGSTEVAFSLQKKEIARKQREECFTIFERLYGEGPIMDGDLIIINFFALVIS